ncbi:hypothetical protein BV25DRAFT_1389656 [Artomyces pyxidatus]|uniref:Uncharacterized protein n=1 Tax=Artomyces pyxidatus TaxID=48021 RepID=A0ACB8TCR4_9AGAM|nr:hypothetical protein BV25DRAFT_1389656 [Artomyces pyxidatus]
MVCTRIFFRFQSCPDASQDKSLFYLTEGYTADERAFHSDDLRFADMTTRMSTFLSYLNREFVDTTWNGNYFIVTYEIHQSGAPDLNQSFDLITSAFLRMYEENGWRRLRSVVAITVR